MLSRERRETMTRGERQKAEEVLTAEGFTTERIRAFFDYIEPGTQTAASERIKKEYPEFIGSIKDTADVVEFVSLLDSFY